MYTTSSTFTCSSLCKGHIVWLLLIVFVSSLLPSVSFAQQPTATIRQLTGRVLVNGRQQGRGAILRSGDVIVTQAGSRVVLELSDGSLLEVGENSRLDITSLFQTSGGARNSRVALVWGWMRAQISPGHQAAGSSFDIDTPNALVGVKFSQPDVEVSYDPGRGETVARALTVPLDVTNLITGQRIIVPIGSMAFITALGITVVSGAAATGRIGSGMSGSGSAAGTKFLLGAGFLAAAGGAAVLLLKDEGTSDKSDDGPFTGTWVYDDNESERETLVLTQNGNSIRGNFEFLHEYSSRCVWTKTGTVEGTVMDNAADLVLNGTMENSCYPYPENFSEEYYCSLGSDESSLQCNQYKMFYLQ